MSTGPLSVSGTSTLGLGTLTLQANSTLNFGTDGIGTLTFAGFTPGTFTLTILNWSSSTANFTAQTSGVDGASDRLIFGSGFNPLDVTSINFNGAPAGVVPLDFGFYEVVPIPETSTWVIGALALGAIGFTQRKRLARRFVIG